MWGLEYALLFGAPENKLELLERQTPLSFPFPDRAMGEMCRWTWRWTRESTASCWKSARGVSPGIGVSRRNGHESAEQGWYTNH
jgi:hypothetical protein